MLSRSNKEVIEMTNKSLYIILYHLINIRNNSRSGGIKNRFIYKRAIKRCKSSMDKLIDDSPYYDSSFILDYCSFMKLAVSSGIISSETITFSDDRIEISSSYNTNGESFIRISINGISDYRYSITLDKYDYLLQDDVILKYMKKSSVMDRGNYHDNRTSYTYIYNKFYRGNSTPTGRKEAFGYLSYELLREIFIVGTESVIDGLKKRR